MFSGVRFGISYAPISMPTSEESSGDARMVADWSVRVMKPSIMVEASCTIA